VPRRRRSGKRHEPIDWRDPFGAGTVLRFGCGPLDPSIECPSDRELREGWAWVRDELLAEWPAGRRPWAWWAFELGEEMPDDRCGEAERLLELDELPAAEMDALLAEGAEYAELSPFYVHPPHDYALDPIRCANAVRRHRGMALYELTPHRGVTYVELDGLPTGSPPTEARQVTTTNGRRRQ
jgi:hypothetical protein